MGSTRSPPTVVQAVEARSRQESVAGRIIVRRWLRCLNVPVPSQGGVKARAAAEPGVVAGEGSPAKSPAPA
jgi:hypothetical protein